MESMVIKLLGQMETIYFYLRQDIKKMTINTMRVANLESVNGEVTFQIKHIIHGLIMRKICIFPLKRLKM